MTSYAAAIDLGIEGVEATIRAKRGTRFKNLPRLLGSHELSLYWVFRKANISVDSGDCILVIADDPLISTTFMRSLCGLLPADEGIVRGDSRSLMVSPPKNRAINGLSVRQTIFMLGGLYGMSDHEIDERTDEVIAMAQVKNMLNRRIEESPGHVKQQISFSLAMVAPVDILAFNGSPVVGGPKFRPTCVEHLATQKANGKGLLISTPDLGLARALCTKAILLDPEESTAAPLDEALEELKRRARSKKRQRRRLRRNQGPSFEEDDQPGF
jgi:ABC-type polysaccharide/polyol phosphate transport system ATPase subunit